MTEKTIGIVQSCYIPWRGFFDLIGKCDEFILFDDMQFTKRDWRNRNQIKTPQGLQWLTIPVNTKGRYLQKICETTVPDPSWAKDHWRSITMNYARAPEFAKYKDLIAGTFEDAGQKDHLSEINFTFLSALCGLLEIDTKLTWSMDLKMAEGKTERLVELCRSCHGTRYISGPAAAGYMDPELFVAAGIDLCYIDYTHYSPYPQLHGEFAGNVSILDSLFNQGAEATRTSLTAPFKTHADLMTKCPNLSDQISPS